MAISITGPVKASDINSELDRGSSSEISINDARNDEYAFINNASRVIPPTNGQIAFPDWRGYDHDATSGPILDEIGISKHQSTLEGICGQRITVGAYFESPFDKGTAVYGDKRGTSHLSNGFYNSEEGIAFQIQEGVISNTFRCTKKR